MCYRGRNRKLYKHIRLKKRKNVPKDIKHTHLFLSLPTGWIPLLDIDLVFPQKLVMSCPQSLAGPPNFFWKLFKTYRWLYDISPLRGITWQLCYSSPLLYPNLNSKTLSGQKGKITLVQFVYVLTANVQKQ